MIPGIKYNPAIPEFVGGHRMRCPYNVIFMPLQYHVAAPITSFLGPYFSVRRERGERWRAAASRRSGVMARMASTVSASGMARPW